MHSTVCTYIFNKCMFLRQNQVFFGKWLVSTHSFVVPYNYCNRYNSELCLNLMYSTSTIFNRTIKLYKSVYSCVVIHCLSMRRSTSAWQLPTSDKTLKQLLSYLLWWERSLWPHYDQIRERNRAQSHSVFAPDRQSIGPSGDTNHITVLIEPDAMIVQHNRLGLTRLPWNVSRGLSKLGWSWISNSCIKIQQTIRSCILNIETMTKTTKFNSKQAQWHWKYSITAMWQYLQRSNKESNKTKSCLRGWHWFFYFFLLSLLLLMLLSLSVTLFHVQTMWKDTQIFNNGVWKNDEILMLSLCCHARYLSLHFSLCLFFISLACSSTRCVRLCLSSSAGQWRPAVCVAGN